ncbi:MAG: tRNA dihydrouridine synthase DusB [Phototrophicales bacterium]|nr:MAG: tRNA dihydrouridine synthase DusB [Phototrophicales bacterium]
MTISKLHNLDTSSLLKPIQIGNITINTPLTLAPMDGMTNYAFRRLVREYSGEDCGLVCTELLSSLILTSPHHPRSRAKFDWQPTIEFPFAVQIYGNDPAMMADAAQILVEAGAPIIDINMGCWVPKIARKGGGAGLLRDVCTATAVVDAVVQAVDVPVTVKVRAGYEVGQPTAINFAKAAEDVGAKLIAVHWRYAKQGFRPIPPDWTIIRQVKEAVRSIPVLGNGDVKTTADAIKMMLETDCDGVMIGRAAAGHPWLFKQIAHEIRTGEPFPLPSMATRAQAALDHARVMVETSEHSDETVTILELRGRLHQYFDEFVEEDERIAQLRYHLVRVNTLADIEALLMPFIEEREYI